MERRAIFRAALKLIKEGKFHGTPMTEIAFHARLTGSTILYFFETREHLIKELAKNIFSGLIEVCNGVRTERLTFEERFHKTWIVLRDHYVQNPEIIAFMEQFPFMPYNNIQDSKNLFQQFHQILIDFFGENQNKNFRSDMSPENLAFLYHQNIIVSAKMLFQGKVNKDETNRLQEIFWIGMTSREKAGTEVS